MPAGDLPLTIYEERKLPPERFENAGQLRELCRMMIAADRKRMALRERVDNLVNGFASYPKGALEKKGFGWFPRVNFRGAEGYIQAQQTPLFDLLTEVDHAIEIDLDIEADTQEQKDDWQNSIQKHFTWLLFKRWRKSFNFHLPLSQREMLVHGIGYHVWPHHNRWIPRTPRTGEILFPDGCSLDFESEMKYFMLRSFVPGEDVYQFIRNEETATKLGWIPDNVWTALTKAQKQNQQSSRSSTNVDELQRKYRRGDIGYAQSSQVGLWLNWVPVAEYDGGISLYAIEENISVGTKSKGYLFKKRFQFDSWPLSIFNYDVGNGEMSSVRGLGVRSKDFFELSNRLSNTMAAQVLISAFPQVKQTVANIDPDKLKLMRIGALSLIPYGVEYGQMQFPPLQQSGLALSREFREMLDNNNQSVAGGAPEPKDRETKYSFMVRSQDQARVSNGMQSLYESNLQQFYEKIYRMVLATPKGELPHQKMAEEFKTRCRKDGVPDKVLKETAIGEIREVTSTGAGSAAIRLQALQLLVESPVYGNAPESKKITIERDLVACTMGGAKVDRYARSLNDQNISDNEDSFVAVESDSLVLGGDAVVGDKQDHVKHAAGALQKAGQVEQETEQGGMQPEQAYGALRKLLEHAARHLVVLQNNRSRQSEFKQLEAEWKRLAQYAEQLRNEVEAKQNEASPEQKLSEDAQVSMAKVQSDAQRKDWVANQNEARKWRGAAFKERLSDLQSAAKINRNGSRPVAGAR